MAQEAQTDLAEGAGGYHLCHSHLQGEETASPGGLLTCSSSELTQEVGEVGRASRDGENALVVAGTLQMNKRSLPLLYASLLFA